VVNGKHCETRATECEGEKEGESGRIVREAESEEKVNGKKG